MKLFYETNVENRNCSEHVLESLNFELDIPCRHIIIVGDEFPELPILDADLELNYETLVIDPAPDLLAEVADEKDDLYFE